MKVLVTTTVLNLYQRLSPFYDTLKNTCGYEIKDDLSDLEYICEYALTHEIESEKIADHGYHIFMKYFQLESDNTYNSVVWNQLKEDLKKINFLI